nr:IS5 family transposase [Desulfocurvibacter africanus]
MVVVDGQGIPLGGTLASASPAELNLAQATLDTISVPRHGRGRPRKRPTRLIVDKGYDADWFRKSLKQRGIEVVCPHRRGRRSRPLQKESELWRYARRWIVERTIAWLGNFRRLVIRHERLLAVYQGFFHIACLLITLRHL